WGSTWDAGSTRCRFRSRRRTFPRRSAGSAARSKPRSPWASTCTARRKGTARAMQRDLNRIVEKNPKLATMQKDFRETWVRQLGTLGGGNHFIEICLDESQDVWVMLHSGSRGIGNVIGRYFIERARREMEKSDT